MIQAAYDDLKSSQHVKRVWKSPGVMATGEPAPLVDAGPLRTISFGVAALRNLTDVPGVHQHLMDSGVVPALLSMLEASKRISGDKCACARVVGEWAGVACACPCLVWRLCVRASVLASVPQRSLPLRQSLASSCAILTLDLRT